MTKQKIKFEDKVLEFLERDYDISSQQEINLIRRIQISDLMFNQHRRETYYTVVALILLEFVSLIVTLLLQNIQISIYNTFMNIAICIIVCFHTSHNSKVWREYSKEYKKLEKKAAKKDLDTVAIKGIKYLENYYAGSDVTEVTIEEAKSILENKIERTVITCDGEKLTKQEKIKNKTYLLGTDGLGRDLFIRIVYGARISLLVGLFAAFINFVVGVFYGAIAGYCGGTVDNIMMRIIDVLDSIPMTLYVILIMVVVGPGISSIIIALGLTFWVKMARIVRGQVLTLKQQEFVKAAIVTGADTKRIIVKHLIPNMMGPIMVNMAMQIPSAIFNEAFLSFVGLGISAPMASWGTLCNDALAGIYVYPYQMVYPAIAISVTILTFNLLSDGLRDAFDPKQRK